MGGVVAQQHTYPSAQAQMQSVHPYPLLSLSPLGDALWIQWQVEPIYSKLIIAL